MTVLDSRSMKRKSDNSSFSLDRLFQNEGIVVQPACGQETYLTVPIVKEWLNPDYEQVNPHTGEAGKPRVFVFRTLAPFITHIEHYVNREVSRKAKDGSTCLAERPVAKDDHDMDAFRYMIMIPPRYIDGAGFLDDDGEDGYHNVNKRLVTCKYTGY